MRCKAVQFMMLVLLLLVTLMFTYSADGTARFVFDPCFNTHHVIRVSTWASDWAVALVTCDNAGLLKAARVLATSGSNLLCWCSHANTQ